LIHFRHGNSHFWHNVSIPLSLPPSSGNKTFGAMRTRRMQKNRLASFGGGSYIARSF
jgi:hypothetical protein